MIKNCFNYIGSKDRIFPLIDKHLDKSKSAFIDLFCGSGVVGINEVNNYEKILLNDACWQLVETLRFMKDTYSEKIKKMIFFGIEKYELSKTNREGYNALREYYNTEAFEKSNFDPVAFYLLVMHSFNHSININSSGGFNVPFGNNRSSFNSSLQAKFKAFQETLYENASKITITCHDFKDIIAKAEKNMSKTCFYCDPPYLSSDSSYGRIQYLGRWNEDDERSLLAGLDQIHEKGGSFLLSNVLENNGQANKILIEWSKKYEVIEIGTSFDNCNYQRKNAGKTKEVLIRNYTC